MKILAIINPKSGLKNSKKALIDALEIFSKYKNKVEIYVSQCKNDTYEYIKKHGSSFDTVCVFGGDGTIHEATNALMELKKKPLIGYFPSGTMNDFGSNFNLTNDWKDIAERVCNGKYSEFDVGNYNGEYFNYVAAFGCFCDVPFSTDRNAKETFGPLAYVFDGIGKLQEIKPVPVKVTVDGKTKEYDALFGLIFSGNRVSGIELVNKRKGRIDDGKFNVMIVEYVKSAIIPNMPNIIETLANQKKYIHWYHCDEIDIEFKEETVWTLDGEEAKYKKKVKIVNINKALKMLN